MAAPFPATGSSALTNPEQGLYFLHKGFTLKTEGTDWLPIDNTETLLESIRFRSKNDKSGVLSVRTEKIPEATSVELYIRKWMRDYPNYGFEVLAAKNFTLNGSPALVVDMLSRSKNKQIRQVIIKNHGQVAILTCLDDQTTFSSSMQNCNKIMKTFSWLNLQSPAIKSGIK